MTCIFLSVLCAWGLLYRTSTERPEDQFGLPVNGSVILEKALEYVSTQPIYKSRYYASGWPDDQYGTCVDVVGCALRENGYDLRERVDQDIRMHPERYDVAEPDINIDFRRVRNLIPYFRANEQVLTNDINQIEEWQAGDIVIFHEHIGIISDRRNAQGIPYVIHHYSRYQKRYEEDILGRRNDIILHVRVAVQ